MRVATAERRLTRPPATLSLTGEGTSRSSPLSRQGEGLGGEAPSGSVLILALWVLTLISLFAAGLVFRARIELQLSRIPWDEVRLAQAARRATLQTAALWRRNNAQATTADASWNQDPDVSVEDESAKIPLNKASPEILRRLLGQNAFVVPAIVDWRSPSGGLEEYAWLGYAPRRGPFQSLEELRLVKGMTPDIFQDIAPFLTVYGEGSVNVNTAPERVLEALGLKPVLISKIVSLRRENVFKSAASIVPLLKQRTFLAEEDLQTLRRLVQIDRLNVQSNNVCLRVRPHLDGIRATREFFVIAAARSLPARIVYWREVER